MPGIVGFTEPASWSDKEADAALLKMRDALQYHEKHRAGACLSLPGLRGSCVSTNPHQERVFSTPDLTVWMDGECWIGDESARTPGAEAASGPALLHALFQSDDPLSALAALDGTFAAAMYDARARKVHLVTDRCGLRQLCWTRRGDALAWATESKALLHLPGFSPVLDRLSLEAFLGIGYFVGNRTWLENVERLAPATCLTWDLRDRTIQERRYWDWGKVSADIGKASSRELAEELGRRFERAVERRCGTGERVGLTLSGGLDSRAILAAMPQDREPVPALTFGSGNSSEVRIAAMAAARKGARHHTFEIGPGNWLHPRIAGVWATDGQLDLYHMHGVEYPGLGDLFATALSGAGGDGIVGGGHLFEAAGFSDYARNVLYLDPERSPALAAVLEEEFSRAGSAHALYVTHRMRCFTLHGLQLWIAGGADYRLPFLDNRFQELLFAIPTSLKRHNRLYRIMLLTTFPDFFKEIPWQATGLPLTWPMWAVRGRSKLRGLRRRLGLRGRGERAGLLDYPGWIRRDPARGTFSELLSSPDALYRGYISGKEVTAALEEHLNGSDRSRQLCRYLTLELWLQQVFEGRWRQGPE